MNKASEVRYAEIERENHGVRVSVVMDLDGGSRRDISTGLPLFDSLLAQLASAACLDLGMSADANLEMGDHTLVEEVGLGFGTAVREALSVNPSIVRCGHSMSVVEDALVLVAVEFSPGAHLEFNCAFQRETVGNISTENIAVFFAGVCHKAGLTVHIHKHAGRNEQHVLEAIFKGFGRALGQAVCRIER